jgi:hypothetical protein
MEALDGGACLFEGELGFEVAIGSGSPKNEDAWRNHENLTKMAKGSCGKKTIRA